MHKHLLVAFLLFAFTGYGFSQSDSSGSVKISGFVKDKDKNPVNGANLVLKNSIDGATSDTKGYFEFETEKTGKQVLIVTSIEFTEKTIELNIVSGENMSLNIVLDKEVKTEEIIVTASTFTSGANSQVTLTPLEIVRIPGADADIYRAITTFPGSFQVDEGSRIAVRGGDPDEVITILDQASLYNPFIFDDNYNGSSFSTINPWGLKGINFSSGGFSAKYGNVLSAVLDLQSYDMPRTNVLFLFAGLANASLSGVFSTTDGKYGATFSVGQFFIKPFLELNGIKNDYNPIPTARNGGGTLVYRPTKNSLLKFYVNYSDDKVGIIGESPVYNGYFENKSQAFFTNLKFTTTPSTVSLLNMSLSFSSYYSGAKFGVLDEINKFIYTKFRTDYSMPIADKVDFGAGVEYEYNKVISNGSIPVYFYNNKPGAPGFNLTYSDDGGRLGAYTELKIKLLNNLAVIPGIRTDYFTVSKKISVDPRLSVVYRVTENSYFKFASGIYHQNPALDYFYQTPDNNLKPEEAIHYILGYEYNREGDYIFRVEGYYKDYKNLVATNLNSYNFSSEGYGFAKGIDVFLKVRLKPKFNGWISYSYTDSKRKYPSYSDYRSGNYDIPHNLSVVAEYNIIENLTIGASYKLSTGKPYTPVTGAVFDPSQNVYIPIYADRNSGRFPTYDRVDMNAQYYTTIFDRFVIFVLAVSNVFNKENLYTYTYNFDYTIKKPVVSTNSRTVYLGFGLQL